MEVQALSHEEGKGSGLLDAFIPSKWHMLSYDKNIFDQFEGFTFFRITKSHDKTMTNTWDGLSDLNKNEK